MCTKFWDISLTVAGERRQLVYFFIKHEMQVKCKFVHMPAFNTLQK